MLEPLPAAPTAPTPRCLTYRGDVTDAVLGQVMVNAWEEALLAVAADYDPETDRTRVEFRYLPPAALAEAVLDGGVVRLPGHRA